METIQINGAIETGPPASDADRWAAVCRRDPAADARFYYSVRTTGVYCRPSCTARPARRENVAFHDSPLEAERAGFRPCKRCRPNEAPLAERHAAIVVRACRTIDDAAEMPDLGTLAAGAGVSRFHFHRVFKAVTGLTPKRYAAARRAERVRGELTRSATVTEAIYAAAFNSSGRFYATATASLGMTPSAFRARGADEKIRYAVAYCSFGAVLVAATDRGVCTILLGDDPVGLVRELQHRFRSAQLAGGNPSFRASVARIISFVDAARLGIGLPVDLRRSTFEQRLWQVLHRREVNA
jgi:AraC family transcriptional regulator of adaptative response/methylated-DNA-[protein]-cysteine methyltransferase